MHDGFRRKVTKKGVQYKANPFFFCDNIEFLVEIVDKSNAVPADCDNFLLFVRKN